MEAPALPPQVTVDYARKYATWKLWVRKHYPHKFLKEGKWVTTPEGYVGQITFHNYHPNHDVHTIEVTCGSKLRYYNNPTELKDYGGQHTMGSDSLQQQRYLCY